MQQNRIAWAVHPDSKLTYRSYVSTFGNRAHLIKSPEAFSALNRLITNDVEGLRYFSDELQKCFYTVCSENPLEKDKLPEGFTQGGYSWEMIADLEQLKLSENLVTHKKVSTLLVTTEKQLEHWTQVVEKGFGLSYSLRDDIEGIWKADGKQAFLFLSYCDDEPAAGCKIYIHQGVAAVYGFATTPGKQKQGIGKSLALSIIQTLKEKGITKIALTTDNKKMKERYEEYGCRTIGGYHRYVHPPQITINPAISAFGCLCSCKQADNKECCRSCWIM